MGAQFQTIKAVFNGGEMSPLMDGRTDSEKYATGCKILENFIVRSYGGVLKRPGTRYGTSDADTADCIRLIPFRRSTDINFVLGFKANAIKVWSYSAGTFTLVATLTTTYDNAEIRALHYCQLNDIMYLTVATEHPKIITRATDGTWSITDVPFQFAPALDPPDDAVTMTLVYDADDWVTLTAYSIGDFVLNGGLLYRCITANSDAAFTGAKWSVAIYLPPWNIGTNHVVGDVVEYFGSNYFCITAHTSATANRPGVGAQWVLIPFTDYRLTASSATFDANEVGSTWQLSPGSTKRVISEPVLVAIGTTTSAAIFIQGSYLARTNWSSTDMPEGCTFQLQESLDRLNFTTIKEWVTGTTQQEGTISYTADAPNTGGWYRWVCIKTVATGTGSMTIEPAVGKLDIPFLIQSYVSTTQVRGIPKLAVDSLIPNEVIGAAFPIWRKGAFSITRGYPRTCSFHDSRLWYACTSTEPMRIWGSQTDDFYTFLTGALDTSGIDVTLGATQANDIQWLASFNRQIVIGTTGEEWTLDSGDQDNALTPSNVRLSRRSRYGSSFHQPVLVGDALLWLTRDNRLREFAYVFEKDGFSAPEMTLLAEHVPSRSNVIQISYSQSPDPIVWLVHTDGTWSGFTYDRENNVTAWHRHNSGAGALEGKLTSLCTLYSSSTAADSLIFLFERGLVPVLESIDGGVMQSAMTSANPTYLNVDIGSTPMIYCDSHVRRAGTFAAGETTITSLTSSNPRFGNGALLVVAAGTGAVSVNASDGTVYEATVSGGSIVVPGDFASGNIIGIPYTAALIPNRFEIQMRDGSAQMRKWRISRLAFRLFNSMYGNFQQHPTYSNFMGSIDTGYRTAIDYRDVERFPYPFTNYGTTTIYHTTGQTLPQVANFDWDESLNIVIGSRHPGPFNLLAMVLEIEIDGTSGAGA